MSKSTNTVVFFDWKTLVYIYFPEVVVVDWMCASFNFEAKSQPFDQLRWAFYMK
jgi:hypothetical protein